MPTNSNNPLPVTLFSTTQLKEMQKPCIRLMLPKLGLNRNTPRALVFGPRKYGGLQLCNLVVEQPVKHVNETLGHIRRGDRVVGDTLITTLRDTQIEIGTSEPFYIQNPQNFEYATQDTRWMYFWRMIHEFQIKVEMYNMWTPKTAYKDDRNIMEVAVMDITLRDKRNYKLKSINKCRLYLECFYISDLMTENSKTIDPRYLNGSKKRTHNELQFPHMRRPTNREWSEWKSFIFRNFLQGPYIIAPMIGKRHKYTQYDRT